MSDLIKEPGKNLALRTDWLTALAALGAFLFFALLAFAMIWVTLRGTFKVNSPTWWTAPFAAFILYLGIKSSERLFRIGVLLLAFGPVSRIVLWLMRASYQARLTDEIFVRWIDSALYFAVCVYIIYWFRMKITHV
jgi:hypothetical protein